MPSSPTGQTVARSRYWVSAALRAGAVVVVLYSAARLIPAVIDLVFGALREGDFSLVWRGSNGELGLAAIVEQGLYLVVAIVVFLRSRRIAATILPAPGTHCPSCGYSRKGLVSTAPCPECGTRFDTSAA